MPASQPKPQINSVISLYPKSIVTLWVTIFERAIVLIGPRSVKLLSAFDYTV
jgi:hypothetical protein